MEIPYSSKVGVPQICTYCKYRTCANVLSYSTTVNHNSGVVANVDIYNVKNKQKVNEL